MSGEVEGIIKAAAPLSVGDYMALALSHPEHGYYMTRDPFGADGDFITAPEISQMFGEILGAWAAERWLALGSPERFILLECGPGRGTLMADMLRVLAGVDGFLSAAQVALMEISPALKAMQDLTLTGHEVTWVSGLDDVPGDLPVIAVGNEFLDALPFEQYEMTAEGWRRRMVSADFEFTLGEVCEVEAPLAHKIGDVFEVSEARERFVADLYARMKVAGGAGLFVDYGHVRSGFGDTFQAVHKHNHVHPLAYIGEADLTSHVDFEPLVAVAPGAIVMEQGAFLKAHGMAQRAAYLLERADEAQSVQIESALERLTSPQAMGYLFKVMEF